MTIELFDSDRNEATPGFEARGNWPDRSLRGYVHKIGLMSAYGGNKVCALEHLEDVYAGNPEVGATPHDYALALVWVDKKDRMVDLFLYSDVDKSDAPKIWAGANPSKKVIVIRNADTQSEWKLCEDSDILLGEDGWHRRHTSNFSEYMNQPPSFVAKGLQSSLQ